MLNNVLAIWCDECLTVGRQSTRENTRRSQEYHARMIPPAGYMQGPGMRLMQQPSVVDTTEI
jgi:hypothetical protein